MFLSLREILYYKSRYFLIGSIIFLIAYVVMILSGLSVGLANEFKEGVENWQAEKVILSDSSNNTLAASQLSDQDVAQIKGGKTSTLSLFSTTVSQGKDKQEDITMFALPDKSVIAPHVLEGRKNTATGEIVISQSLADKGFEVGDKIKVGNYKVPLKIVGISKSATYSATPIVYGSFATLAKAQNGQEAKQAPAVNAVVVKSGKPSLGANQSGNLKMISIKTLINRIPGYSAQNTTLSAMIYFMFVIVLLIVGVFMYVITLQKVPIFGIMKAQGISNGTIAKTLLWQGFWLGVVGVAVALGISYGTSFILPAAMPFMIDWGQWLIYGGILVLVSIFGSVFSIITIRKVDPTKAIGA